MLKYTNFIYDPQRQGYDSSIWRTRYGEPVVNSNALRLTNASIIHYGDILRGAVEMIVNVATAPVAGEDKQWGLYSLNKGSYIVFDISDAVFSGLVSDGTNTSSTTLTWDSDWTGVNTRFEIRWEAGTARFRVNGVQQVGSGAGDRGVITNVAVTGDPLSLIVTNNNADTLSVVSVGVKTPSYWLNEAHEDTSDSRLIFEGDRITISESATVSGPSSNPSVSDQLNITESVTTSGSMNPALVSDQLDITESVTTSGSMDPSLVSDQLNITESVTMDMTLGGVSVSDQLNITEDVTQPLFSPLLVEGGGQLNISESVTVTVA